MNLNLDGSPLSIDDLFAIAEKAGLDIATLRHQCGELHNANASLSVLSFATRAACHDLWSRGELRFGTSLWERPLTVHAIDQEVFDFLVGTKEG